MIYVGAGGILGALLRYQLSKWIGERWVVSFPLATLLINVTGSFLLGWLTVQAGHLWPAHETEVMLFLGVGGCGAYTTFSTFCYETMILFREGRVSAALVYASLSAILGTAAAALGLHA
ncbi:MAG: fluoride efflux transporter CrcB [Alicyclobacillus sp.]|nr:fluoride efflux transporter CrcB [Alicyclobacillus sp.]